MKNTLLALMLVSSLFVISCGADATKPTDAYKSQKTEISSGTKEATDLQITATSQTVDVSSFALPGEKVTEIVEATVDGAVVKAPASTKNTDGGIYQFTVTGTTVTSVTYKYTKTIIAPIKEATTTATATAGGSSESTATVTDPTFTFLSQIVSVTHQGSDITTDIKSISESKISFYNQNLTGNITIKYQYMDASKISEKPTKEATIEATTQITLTQNDAGKTYVCKNVTTGTYYYGIVPADGIIPSKSLSGAQQNNDYQLWLY